MIDEAVMQHFEFGCARERKYPRRMMYKTVLRRVMVMTISLRGGDDIGLVVHPAEERHS